MQDTGPRHNRARECSPNTEAAGNPLAQVKRPDLPPLLITYRLKRHKQNYLTMLVVVVVSYYQ